MARATPFLGHEGPGAQLLRLGDVPLIHAYDDARFARLAAAVPPAAQIAVIRALFFDLDFDPARVPQRDAWLTRLQGAGAAVAPGVPALLR